MEYIETGGKKPKVSVNVLEQTDTSVIISHLFYKHRVGLLAVSAATSLAFIVYDKVLTLFIGGI